jgi:hypothetical protein
MPLRSAKSRLSLKLRGWQGGMNTRDDDDHLTPDEARLIENISLLRSGAAQKRLGCDNRGTFGSSGDRILSAYAFYRVDLNITQMLIHTTAGNLYRSTNFSTGVPPTWTLIGGGYSTTQPMSFETFNTKVYFCDGVSNYSWWDGTTLGSSASAPKGKYLRLWQGSMWVSGVAGVALVDRVYRSNAGNAEVFDAAAWVDIYKGDGDEVSTLVDYGLALIVGKFKRSFEIYDPVTYANRAVDFEKGFTSHWAVVRHEDDLYYLSDEAICKYMSDSPSEVISEKVGGYFSRLYLQMDRARYAVAAVYDGHIFWGLPLLGSNWNNFQLDYFPGLGGVTTAYGDRRDGPWVRHTMPVHFFLTVKLPLDERLFGSAVGSNTWVQMLANVRHDLGTRFISILETAWFNFGDWTITKYLRDLRVFLYGQFRLQIRRNLAEYTYKEIVLDPATSNDLTAPPSSWNDSGELLMTNPDAYGRSFKFIFTDQAAEPVRLDTDVPEWGLIGMTLEGSPLGRRT